MDNNAVPTPTPPAEPMENTPIEPTPAATPEVAPTPGVDATPETTETPQVAATPDVSTPAPEQNAPVAPETSEPTPNTV